MGPLVEGALEGHKMDPCNAGPSHVGAPILEGEHGTPAHGDQMEEVNRNAPAYACGERNGGHHHSVVSRSKVNALGESVLDVGIDGP